jgi:PIN domain nuclease of toxin-antitoxin system
VNDQFVPDTHALFFYLTDSSKLKAGAKAVFDRFDCGEVTLFVPWIVIAELFWLAKKLASSMDFNAEFQKLRNHPRIVFIGLDAEQVLNFPKLEKITEMHDRIIAGVAYKFSIPLITRDQNIKDSGYVKTIWN